MPVMQAYMQLPTDELLKAVAQLNAPDLEHFTQQVIHLLAQRRVPVLPRAEADLPVYPPKKEGPFATQHVS